MSKEYGNAFTELNDPPINLAVSKPKVKAKELGDYEATGIDYDYIEALEYGDAANRWFGNRYRPFCMLLTDTTTIRDVAVILTMK